MLNKLRNKVNCRVTHDVFTAIEVLEISKLTKCLLFFFCPKLNFHEINVFPWKFFITTKCHLNAIFWWKCSVGILLTWFNYCTHTLSSNVPDKQQPGHIPPFLQAVFCVPLHPVAGCQAKLEGFIWHILGAEVPLWGSSPDSCTLLGLKGQVLCPRWTL